MRSTIFLYSYPLPLLSYLERELFSCNLSWGGFYYVKVVISWFFKHLMKTRLVDYLFQNKENPNNLNCRVSRNVISLRYFIKWQGCLLLFLPYRVHNAFENSVSSFWKLDFFIKCTGKLSFWCQNCISKTSLWSSFRGRLSLMHYDAADFE